MAAPNRPHFIPMPRTAGAFVREALVRCGPDVFTLDQLGKDLRGALEAQPRVVEPEHYEDPSACLEAQFVVPLQLLTGVLEREAVGTKGVNVHGSPLAFANSQTETPDPTGAGNVPLLFDLL